MQMETTQTPLFTPYFGTRLPELRMDANNPNPGGDSPIKAAKTAPKKKAAKKPTAKKK
jgi:hypothetical protein